MIGLLIIYFYGFIVCWLFIIKILFKNINMYILILWSINLIYVWIFIDRMKILCLFDKNEFVEWLYGMMNL